MTCGLDNNGINQLNLVELYVGSNPKITNINHMTNLRKLVANGSSGMADNGINQLNLIELNSQYNPKIRRFNHSIQGCNSHHLNPYKPI